MVFQQTSKVEVVANGPTPTNVSDLRSFLGFASYYRWFMEDFAKLAPPLHKAVVAWSIHIKHATGAVSTHCWTD